MPLGDNMQILPPLVWRFILHFGKDKWNLDSIMLVIPLPLLQDYQAALEHNGIPIEQRPHSVR